MTIYSALINQNQLIKISNTTPEVNSNGTTDIGVMLKGVPAASIISKITILASGQTAATDIEVTFPELPAIAALAGSFVDNLATIGSLSLYVETPNEADYLYLLISCKAADLEVGLTLQVEIECKRMIKQIDETPYSIEKLRLLFADKTAGSLRESTGPFKFTTADDALYVGCPTTFDNKILEVIIGDKSTDADISTITYVLEYYNGAAWAELADTVNLTSSYQEFIGVPYNYFEYSGVIYMPSTTNTTRFSLNAAKAGTDDQLLLLEQSIASGTLNSIPSITETSAKYWIRFRLDSAATKFNANILGVKLLK